VWCLAHCENCRNSSTSGLTSSCATPYWSGSPNRAPGSVAFRRCWRQVVSCRCSSPVAQAEDDVRAWLSDLGLSVHSRAGIRIFHEYLRTPLRSRDELGTLVRLEQACSRSEPFALRRRPSPFTHTSKKIAKTDEVVVTAVGGVGCSADTVERERRSGLPGPGY
jgi:hypothetical protein